MFELAFAWALMTFVLGKSAEAVVHAWNGTSPPGHTERMARIRAREAAAHHDDAGGRASGFAPSAPSEGFRGWARTVWVDGWNAATERHQERWPAKAAKKAGYARRRWAWWDHVEDEAGRRWEQRRAARDSDGADPVSTDGKEATGASPDTDTAAAGTQRDEAFDSQTAGAGRRANESSGATPWTSQRWQDFLARFDDLQRRSAALNRPGPASFDGLYTAWETPQRYGQNVAWEELTDNEKALWRLEREADPQRREEGAFLRGRLTAYRDAVGAERAAPDAGSRSGSGEEDVVDAEVVDEPTPDQTTDTPAGAGAPLALASTATTTAPQDKENSMSQDNTEAIGLDGALAFANGVVASTTANVSTTEQVASAMEQGGVGSAVVGRTQQLMEAMDSVKATAEALQADLQAMKSVQEQYDANPDAGDKDYVATNAGR